MQISTIASLRTRIAALERGPGAVLAPQRLSFGMSELDDRLPNRGLALGAVHEVFAGGPAVEHGAAPALFAAGALARRPGPVVWIVARRDLYPPALARAGLDPGRIVFVEARQGDLPGHGGEPAPPRACGRGVRARGPVRPHRFTAAAAGGRGHRRARFRAASVAPLRRPGAERALCRFDPLADHRPPFPHAPDVPGLGRPVWRLGLLRCRGAQAASIIVETPDAQGRLAIPSYLTDRPLAPARLRRTARGAALGHAGA